MAENARNEIARLNQQVVKLFHSGYYSEAIDIATRSTKIARDNLESQDPLLAQCLNNQAELNLVIGDYATAEPLVRDALEIRRLILGEKDLSLSISLTTLAKIYDLTGYFDQAEKLYLEVLEIRRALGENHPDFAEALNNLAGLYRESSKFEEAEALYQQAKDIWTNREGRRHPDYPVSLNNLAGLYSEMGKFLEAEEYYKEAIEVWSENYRGIHPLVASGLHNLAESYRIQGKYQEAEEYYNQASNIWIKSLGKEHPSYAICTNNLGLLFAATDRIPEALEQMVEASAIEDELIQQVFSIGSEKHRMAQIRNLRGHLYTYLSLVHQHLTDSQTAVQSALDLVLRRKGIGAEALAAQRNAILGGRYPESEEKLREHRTLNIQISQMTMTGPSAGDFEEYKKSLEKFKSKREQIESQLAQLIPEIKLQKRLREANIQAIAEKLDHGTALIEFIRYQEFDFKNNTSNGGSKWKRGRYAAFILKAGNSNDIKMIDLGDAHAIDTMISEFRVSITQHNISDTHEKSDSESLITIGHNLRKTIFDKVVSNATDIKKWFIAPDGDLSRLPFEALPLNDGRYVVDEYQISYLSTGRDIIRFEGELFFNPSEPLVFADPDFDLESENSEPSESDYSILGEIRDRNLNAFTRLEGSQLEGIELSTLLNVKPLLEKKALEKTIKSRISPSILHIATHGYFLPDRIRGRDEKIKVDGLERLYIRNLENPLLRSGLAMAGANTWLKHGKLPEEAEDGLLTALDVTGMDLISTEVVVLSACETGLGDVQIGEGVFGLRRAFMLAGAKTLIMSLWKVPDLQTFLFMDIFYHNILKGKPRVKALKKAQLAIKAEYPEPFFWGAFICQGDPRPLPEEMHIHQ